MCKRNKIVSVDWLELTAVVQTEVTCTLPDGRVIGVLPIRFSVDLVALSIEKGGANAAKWVRELYDYRDVVFAIEAAEEDLLEADENLEEAEEDLLNAQQDIAVAKESLELYREAANIVVATSQ